MLHLWSFSMRLHKDRMGRLKFDMTALLMTVSEFFNSSQAVASLRMGISKEPNEVRHPNPT